MTITLLRGSDLIGRAVVDASTGDDVAEIRDIVFGGHSGVITGFTLRRRGVLGRRLRTVLPIENVSSVGTGAVMIADIGAITEGEDAPDEMHVAGSSDVIDDEVITVSGRSLGTVRDVVILGGPAPRVVGFEIGGGSVGNGLVPVGRHTAVSGSALVVPDDFEQRIRSDLTGLAAELALIERSSA